MNQKIAYVLQGFLSLSDDEKNDVIEAIVEYEQFPSKMEETLRDSIAQSLANADNEPCPCCTQTS